MDRGRNQMDSGYILQLELTEFAGSLNVGVKDKIQG